MLGHDEHQEGTTSTKNLRMRRVLRDFFVPFVTKHSQIILD